MIKIYSKKRSGKDPTLLKIVEWMEYRNIQFEVITPLTINKDYIIAMLRVSDYGFDSILIDHKVKYQMPYENGSNEISTELFIQYILKNLCVLKPYIVFDENKLVTGFNQDDIRTFIPKAIRSGKRNKKL